MLDAIQSLTDDAREAIRTAARLQFQHFRALGSGPVRSRGRLLAASGRLAEAEIDAQGASVLANDSGSVGRVLLRWSDQESGRCSCSAFARRATCPHVIGLLEALIAALGGSVRSTGAPGDEEGAKIPRGALDPDPSDGMTGDQAWLFRLDAYREALEASRSAGPTSPTRRGSTGANPWDAVRPGDLEVRYVLRMVERRSGTIAQLEAQVRERPGPEGAARPWKTLPFSDADRRGTGAASKNPQLRDLGEAHARVAAVATGVPDSSWYLETVSRDVALARVDRTVAEPLLRTAREAAPVYFSPSSHAEPVALDLHLEGLARLELFADDEGAQVWTVRGRVRLAGGAGSFGGGAIEAAAVETASSDGIVISKRSSRDSAAILTLLDDPGAAAILLDLAEAPLVIPREDVETLSVLSGVADLMGEGLKAAARPVTPVPCLRVDAPLNAGRGVRMECYLHFDYGGSRVQYDDPAPMIQTLDGRATPRQPEFEAQCIARFFDLGGRRTQADRREECDASVQGQRFPGMAATLLDEGWRVTAEDRLLRGASSVSLSVRSGVDWFDLEGGVKFGDEVIPFPAALSAAQSERGYVELGDGSRGLLPDTWLSRWKLATVGRKEGDAVRFDESQAWILATLVDEVEAASGDPFTELRQKLANLGRPAPRKAPASFRGELRPYQEEGLGWLTLLDEVSLSGCLADDMGLGKTVQLLSYLLHRRELAAASDAAPLHSLVVAPLSLVFNWLGEAARFAPTLPTVDFTGPARWKRLEEAEPGSLLVTTYGALRRDAIRLRDTQFDVAILDESQAIKNRASQTAKSARVLKARRRVALTGTPIENHLGELWSQLEFLNPGMLGHAAAFERVGAPRAKDDLIDEGRELLSRALRPFLLRRKKSDVLKDLPPKTEQVLRAPLKGAQKTAYDELSRYYRSELSKSRGQKRLEKREDPDKLDMNVLAALTRLRQCACHPGLVDPELLAERSGKLDLVLPMLTDIVRRGNKAIVFSSFTRLLDLVRTRLETERVPYLTLDGKTKHRGELVTRFQTAEDGVVFLISIKAGGAGLNLTAADYVFILDPWWNPAVEAQAVDRAHRIGRTRPVNVYRVLTENTIEARVSELQSKKAQLAEEILSGATSALADLTTDDLAFLLS